MKKYLQCAVHVQQQLQYTMLRKSVVKVPESLAHATSGVTAGPKDNVVGYLAACFEI